MNNAQKVEIYNDLRPVVLESYRKKKEKEKQEIAKNQKKVAYSIKEVQSGKLFTKKAVYEVLNETTGAKYEVTGDVVNFWLSGLADIKARLEEGECDSFRTLNLFIKFKKCEV